MDINFLIKWIVIQTIRLIRFPLTPRGRDTAILALLWSLVLLVGKLLLDALSGSSELWFGGVVAFFVPAFLICYLLVLIAAPHWRQIFGKVSEFNQSLKFWIESAEKDVAGGRKRKNKLEAEIEPDETILPDETSQKSHNHTL